MLELIEQLALPGIAVMVGLVVHRWMNAQTDHAFPPGTVTWLNAVAMRRQLQDRARRGLQPLSPNRAVLDSQKVPPE